MDKITYVICAITRAFNKFYCIDDSEEDDEDEKTRTERKENKTETDDASNDVFCSATNKPPGTGEEEKQKTDDDPLQGTVEAFGKLLKEDPYSFFVTLYASFTKLAIETSRSLFSHTGETPPEKMIQRQLANLRADTHGEDAKHMTRKRPSPLTRPISTPSLPGTYPTWSKGDWRTSMIFSRISSTSSFDSTWRFTWSARDVKETVCLRRVMPFYYSTSPTIC